MTIRRRSILGVATLWLGLGACGRRDAAREAESRALAESAAVYEEISARFRKVGETPNLQGPESARYDRDLDVWLVSNVNGAPGKRDNNGYISRLRPDGTPYNLKFIEGGKKGVTLNAPKGLAINGDTLWVADIDFARAFNKRTGELIANVSTRAKFLNGATVGPDGAIYMTDTGVIGHFQPGVGMIGAKLDVPVVPVRLEGMDHVLHRTWKMARRGPVRVKFGPALRLSGDDYLALAKQVEDAVKSM